MSSGARPRVLEGTLIINNKDSFPEVTRALLKASPEARLPREGRILLSCLSTLHHAIPQLECPSPSACPPSEPRPSSVTHFLMSWADVASPGLTPAHLLCSGERGPYGGTQGYPSADLSRKTTLDYPGRPLASTGPLEIRAF